jgi:hypothetical protein
VNESQGYLLLPFPPPVPPEPAPVPSADWKIEFLFHNGDCIAEATKGDKDLHSLWFCDCDGRTGRDYAAEDISKKIQEYEARKQGRWL